MYRVISGLLSMLLLKFRLAWFGETSDGKLDVSRLIPHNG